MTSTKLLGPEEVVSLKSMGLLPSDLLRRTRFFVLVEGAHDEAVFRALIGEEVHRARGEFLVLRGGVGLRHVVESQFLTHFTDAVFIVVLDNLRGEYVANLWAAARKLASDESVSSAQSYVIRALPPSVDGKRVAENTFLKEFFVSALNTDEQDRFLAYGVDEPDIQHYLPVRAFVPGKRTWQELYDSWTTRSEDVTIVKQYKNYKGWLEKVHNARFTPEQFQDALGKMDHVPSDVQNLLDFLLRSTDRIEQQLPE